MRPRSGGLRAYSEDPSLIQVCISYSDDHTKANEHLAAEHYVKEWRQLNPYAAFYFCLNSSEVTHELLFFRTLEAEKDFRSGWIFEVPMGGPLV